MKRIIYAGLICAIGLTLLAVRSYSQGQQAPDYQAIADKFFAMLQQGQSAAAIDYVFSTNPQMEKLADEKDQLKAKIGSMDKIVGPYISHDKLAETKVAGMFVYQHYFVAYDRQPMSLRLKFYKARDTWRVLGIQFNDDLCDDIGKRTDEQLYNQLK